MIDILVYLLDQQYKEEIISTLGGVNFIYHQASTIDELFNICSQEDIDIILVWPANVEIVEDLITMLQTKNFGYIPVVPVINKREDIIPMMKIPVVEVIQFPLPRLEFISLLYFLVEELQFRTDLNNGQHWYGQLKEFSVGELIKILGVSQRDAVLNISLKEHKGQILFQRGKIIQVTLRNLSGETSFQKMIYLKRGNFHIHFTRVELPEEIEIDHQQLLSQLRRQPEDMLLYYKSLQEIEDEVVAAEIPPPDQHDEVKNNILDFCRRGMNVDEMLVGLGQDNWALLGKIRELFQAGHLVFASDYHIKIKPETGKKNLGKFFSTLSNLFKKEEKEVPVSKPVQVEPKKVEKIQTRLIYHSTPTQPGDIKKIKNFFEEV
jgi:hypothetical protein